MYDKHYVGLDLTGFQDNGIQRPVSRVTLKLDDNNVLTAGDDTGLEIISDCPHATQEMVNALLAQLKGTQYQMFNADDARIDPAAELGDGITAGGVYSVISRIADDGSGFPGVTAPGEAELDDEYPAGGPMTQEFNRKIAQTNSRITKTAEQIRLEVENEVKGLNAAITIELNKITTEVNDVNAGLSSKIEQTASSLTSQITDTANGLNSKIEQTASFLTTKINDTQNGLSSQIQQTAASLTAQITNKEAGLKNEIKATADNLTVSISATDERVTTLSTTVDGINVDVNGKDGKFSKLSQNVDGVSVRVGNAEGKITTVETTINGLTVTDSAGSTYISGSKIATKSITTEQLAVDALKTDRIYNKDGTKISIDCSNTSDLKIGGVDSGLPYDKVSIRGKKIFFGMWGDVNSGVEISNYDKMYVRPASSHVYDLGDSTHCWRYLYVNSLEIIPNGVAGGSKISSIGIIPKSTDQFLGNDTYKWSRFYVKDVNLAGNLSMGAASRVGFFGHAAMSKTTIFTMMATTNTTALDVANKLNDLITALKNYGLI